MRFKVYNKVGEFLGVIYGDNEKHAIKEALLFDMKGACTAVAIKEKSKVKPIENYYLVQPEPIYKH